MILLPQHCGAIYLQEGITSHWICIILFTTCIALVNKHWNEYITYITVFPLQSLTKISSMLCSAASLSLACRLSPNVWQGLNLAPSKSIYILTFQSLASLGFLSPSPPCSLSLSLSLSSSNGQLSIIPSFFYPSHFTSPSLLLSFSYPSLEEHNRIYLQPHLSVSLLLYSVNFNQSLTLSLSLIIPFFLSPPFSLSHSFSLLLCGCVCVSLSGSIQRLARGTCAWLRWVSVAHCAAEVLHYEHANHGSINSIQTTLLIPKGQFIRSLNHPQIST